MLLHASRLLEDCISGAVSSFPVSLDVRIHRQVVWYDETRWLGRETQAGTRAGTHWRNVQQARNVGPPMLANTSRKGKLGSQCNYGNVTAYDTRTSNRTHCTSIHKGTAGYTGCMHSFAVARVSTSVPQLADVVPAMGAVR